jgi:hypothetical protein
MTSKIVLLIGFLASSLFSFSQRKFIKELSFDTIRFAGINPAGELFVISKKSINKYDKDGSLMNTTPFTSSEALTSFDSWHLTQVVLYYRNKQKIEIYNPQLDLRKVLPIDSSFAVEPFWIAASTDEKHYWIFDMADESLKKINPITEEVVVDVVVSITNSTKIAVLGMREYQRFLFLQTSSNLMVFNGMGKHIRTIDLKDATSFDFFGEEILILKKDTIQFISLFSAEQREIIVKNSYTKVMLTDDRLFGVNPNSIEILAFQSN